MVLAVRLVLAVSGMLVRLGVLAVLGVGGVLRPTVLAAAALRLTGHRDPLPRGVGHRPACSTTPLDMPVVRCALPGGPGACGRDTRTHAGHPREQAIAAACSKTIPAIAIPLFSPAICCKNLPAAPTAFAYAI